MLFGLMMKALQRPKTHLNMASIDKLSGDEVIEECLLSVVEIIEKWQDRQAAVLVIKRENHRAHHRACLRKAMAMERGDRDQEGLWLKKMRGLMALALVDFLFNTLLEKI